MITGEGGEQDARYFGHRAALFVVAALLAPVTVQVKVHHTAVRGSGDAGDMALLHRQLRQDLTLQQPWSREQAGSGWAARGSFRSSGW